MGGDHAPLEIVKGSVLALERAPGLSVLLVGDEKKVRAAVEEVGGPGDRLDVRHASEVIEMGESPVDALRRKEDTSIKRCMEALRAEDVDAVISAGDTGGVVAAATLFGRRLKGVKRHGIAIPVPTIKGRALLCDVGANIHCKPIHLLQYAIMASCYAKEILGIENPTVGLLSIGEEEAKGNDLVKRSRNLLSRADLNFVGNVEGQAMFRHLADVIVCDGFVGNVVLKVAEGLAQVFMHTLTGLVESAKSANGGRHLPDVLQGLRPHLDYSTTGGAPLLGVQGSVIICHGRSKATAFANAMQVAIDFTRTGVNERIVEEVTKVGMMARVAEFFHKDPD